MKKMNNEYERNGGHFSFILSDQNIIGVSIKIVIIHNVFSPKYPMKVQSCVSVKYLYAKPGQRHVG